MSYRVAWRLRPAAIVSGWAFVVFAGLAVGHGLWAVIGSGERVARIDAQQVSDALPIELSPAMNPIRVLLRAGYAPVGSTRLRYQATLVSPHGATLWEKSGGIGSQDNPSEDNPSFARFTTSLGTLAVVDPGVHVFSLRFSGGSMDDLRDASLEVRRNVAEVDRRVVWGGGLLAVASLLVRLLTPPIRAFDPALPRAREDEAA